MVDYIVLIPHAWGVVFLLVCSFLGVFCCCWLVLLGMGGLKAMANCNCKKAWLLLLMAESVI